MITKEKNSIINLSVPNNLKEEFTNLAYNLGTNPANLLKMLMTQIVHTKQINFKYDPFENATIEPLDISDWDNNLKKRVEKNTKKLEKIFK